MKVLITGAKVFIGKNLTAQLAELRDLEILVHTRGSSVDELQQAIERADFVCHMAGANRPVDENGFVRDNTDFTKFLCDLISKSGRHLPIIFASSIHAENTNQNSLHGKFGASKLAAEQVLLKYSADTGAKVYLYRLPH